ncbi:transporter substrate-binding domain-containing protein [Flexibacterium corallicola]|uniref:transporter substrate-binding domain-containing protein n=1 Tax=Flexibacterium corallicola TaxID=3037259 RepID=UPI00286F8E8A|nr:transporter substrate-binding domain-containing protein [Pseudovibrio sp. M1P-2-3]
MATRSARKNEPTLTTSRILLIVLAFVFSCLQAQASKILFVGTTGDYAPLTWYDEKNERFTGSSIDLVQSFAKDENYKLKFVKTTWPDLSSDLAKGRFQMAVGGITTTKRRAKLFLFSAPIATFGKTALMRCSDQSRFLDFTDIDQEDVRIVENRGGTNEIFARTHIKNATLIVVANNSLPFTYLTNKKADVMFTDSIEVDYVTRINPSLCGLRSRKLFTHSEKAFMFRKDEAELLQQFNTWLQKHNKVAK